ncbi:MAG TPA: rhomboid family intramembrane serine protease [Myxococcota bacterium]|nr:rhomboid family intramembrane serine protease [Myxococcota bacterium]
MQMRIEHQQTSEPSDAERARLLIFAERIKNTKPIATICLLAACGIMFALQLAWSGIDYTPGVVRLGANVPQLVKDGQLYRLVSCMFLHGGIEHLLMNMFVLYYLGGFTERLLGRRRFLVLYAVSGLCGSMASAFISGGHISLGASGAMWGMLGGLAALAFRPGGLVPAAFLPRLKRAALINLAINVPVSFLPRVDMFAHFGGGLAGALLIGSGLLTQGLDLAEEHTLPAARAGIGWLTPASVLAAGMLLVGPIWAVCAGSPWQLGRPVSWHEYRLGETGLSVKIPSCLSNEPRAIHREDGVYEFVAGSLETDPVLLDFLVVPLEGSGLDSSDLQAGIEQLKKLRQVKVPDGASRTEKVRERLIGGRRTVEDAFEYNNGLKLRRFSQIVPGWIIQLEAVIWPDAPENLHLDIEQALAP